MRYLIIPLVLAAAACATPAGPDPQPRPDDQGAASQSADPTPAQLAEGERLVEIACASCHEDEPGAISPHPEAPNLTTLSDNYPVELLDEAFAEGIMVGHPDMPEFRLQPDQITALIGYLESIQVKRGI